MGEQSPIPLTCQVAAVLNHSVIRRRYFVRSRRAELQGGLHSRLLCAFLAIGGALAARRGGARAVRASNPGPRAPGLCRGHIFKNQVLELLTTCDSSHLQFARIAPGTSLPNIDIVSARRIRRVCR